MALCGKNTVLERFQFRYFSWPSNYVTIQLLRWVCEANQCPANEIFLQLELIHDLVRGMSSHL